MKTIALLRISSDQQDLQRQRNDIKSFSKSKNFKLIKTFEEIMSGSKTRIEDRTGINDMMSYLDANNDIKNVLVLEVSRIGRRNVDVLNVVEQLSPRDSGHFFDWAGKEVPW